MSKAVGAPIHYQHCSGLTSGSCNFGSAPQITLETGNAIAPRVEIWKCAQCGHGVTLPAMPDVAPLYEARGSEDFLTRDGIAVRALKQRAFTKLAHALVAHLPTKPQLIVDFGIGNGMLASCLADAVSAECHVYGLDFFPEAPGSIGRASYRSFSQASDLHGMVDLLTCFHVLEHDDDSDMMLGKLLAFLRPGGTLVVEVPNMDCVWTPWFGKSCANWYAPFHRVHFSRRSLHGLFERHRLLVVAEQDICGPTFALSFATLLGVKPSGFLFAISAALRPLQWLAEKLTQRPSALRIIARKP
ncbi:MAG: class I SAM-dependent methyltransferase [Pseudomonadota bacterium]